jgi:hypothetical protein
MDNQRHLYCAEHAEQGSTHGRHRACASGWLAVGSTAVNTSDAWRQSSGRSDAALSLLHKHCAWQPLMQCCLWAVHAMSAGLQHGKPHHRLINILQNASNLLPGLPVLSVLLPPACSCGLSP